MLRVLVVWSRRNPEISYRQVSQPLTLTLALALTLTLTPTLALTLTLAQP